MKEYQQLKDLLTSMEDDIAKFGEKGVASAGARLRKTLQEIKKTAQEMHVFSNPVEIKKKEQGILIS